MGSLLRTADGMGAVRVYLTGYTPYPLLEKDTRLPHIANKIHRQIQKTALGAEDSVDWCVSENIDTVIAKLQQTGYMVCGLEQARSAVALPTFSPPNRVAVILGREVEGLEEEVMAHCDQLLEIPMFGKKESFNVVQAAAMTLFYLRFS